MKAEKIKVMLNLKKKTNDDLERFCDRDGLWNKSTFTDKAIQEKLEKEERKCTTLKYGKN